jgi:TRAP-type C4-dicarboxylate transport system substrate-binding protein
MVQRFKGSPESLNPQTINFVNLSTLKEADMTSKNTNGSVRRFTALFLVVLLGMLVAAPGAALAESPKVMKLTTHYNRPHPYALNAFYFAERVKERSGGKLEIRVYEGAALASLKHEFKVVADGVVDMGWMWLSAYEAGKMPTVNVFNIPFFTQSLEGWHKKAKEIRELVQPEFARYNTVGLTFHATGSYVIAGQKPFTKHDDLKGLLVRAPGGFFTKAVQMWGAKPVSLTAGDVYSALQRGTCEATVISLPSYWGFKLNEVTTHVNLTPFPCLATANTIYKPLWDKLSAEERRIILDAGDDAMFNYLKLYKKELKEMAERAKATGEIINHLTPKEIERMRESTAPLWDSYLKKTGETGKKIVEVLRRPD